MQPMHTLTAYQDEILRILEIRFPALPLKRWMLSAAAGVMLGMTVIATISAFVFGGIPTCGGSEALLAYPQYTARGIILGYDYGCGAIHPTCKLRADGSGIHDCSPLARPGRITAARSGV
jgi:hypothetical protein